MEQQYRGDGTTTRQMKDAPIGALYVWCGGDLHYPKKLAMEIGRNDLRIVAPSFLEHDQWRGLRMPVVLDHAFVATREQFYAIKAMSITK